MKSLDEVSTQLRALIFWYSDPSDVFQVQHHWKSLILL